MSRRIPDEEWLHHAKRTAVGTTRRVRHNAEGRENMTVGNEPDRWWCRCNRCGVGAVVKKEHALTVLVAPVLSGDMSLPSDMIQFEKLPEYQQVFVAGFLSGKNMDRMYIDAPVFWSESRHRLMLQDSGGRWMGRDTSGRSPQKWLTYNRQPYVQVSSTESTHAILTEDMFSAWKVAYAAKGMRVTVYCSLGAHVTPALLARLIAKHTHVSSFYDGDAAGWDGARYNALRLRPFDISNPCGAKVMCAPTDMDPKDMTVLQIQQHITSRRMHE